MKIFNASKFYKDFHIQSATRGNKHCRPGWVQINCPFCEGSKDYHLGFYIKTGAYKCWRCGKHSQISVVKKLLACTTIRAKEILSEYSTRQADSTDSSKRKSIKAVECRLPPGTIDIPERHRKYLLKRKYNPDVLISTWGLKAVGPVGRYKWRIIAPIYLNGKLVSYQGRDITDKSEMKYKACKSEEEVIDHQDIVYGYDLAEGDSCIVEEGVTDVWRLGPGAVCCFGISFTIAQVNLIAKRWSKVFILFDAEEQAQKQANILASLLAARGCDVEILELEKGDPGEMEQEEADNLMKELGLKGYTK